MTFHVDYFDRNVGKTWKDTWAEPAFVKRQKERVRKRGLTTPQFIVNDVEIEPCFDTVMPDTKKEEIRKKVEEQAKRKPTYEIIIGLDDFNADTALVTVSLNQLEAKSSLPPDARVVPVLFARHVECTPSSGWLKGMKLRGSCVARHLGDPIQATHLIREPSVVELPLPEGLEFENLGVAFILESPKAKKVIESVAALFDDL